jgi:CBS-domain-containing membrane protein
MFSTNRTEPADRDTRWHLPAWLLCWFGIRTDTQVPPPKYALYVWPFVGAFGALAVLQAIFGHSIYFMSRSVPSLITSYGASVVLCFDKIESPLAQPRALIGGHFLSGIVGIVVARVVYGTSQLEEESSSSLAWLGASLATAIAILVMQLTKTTHPPAGATALLPVLDPAVNKIGWYLLPVLLLSSSMTMFIALLVNNIQRQYPIFWWTATPPEKSLPITERPGPSMNATIQVRQPQNVDLPGRTDSEGSECGLFGSDSRNLRHNHIDARRESSERNSNSLPPNSMA